MAIRQKCDKKRKSLLNATLKLVNNNGFHDAPMSKIAKMAAVSPATIYIYFENKQDLINQSKKIEINIKDKVNTKNGYYIFGIGNRLEQVIANLLDNSISFSEDNKKILVEIYKGDKDKIILKVTDDGKGFIEIDTKKIFDRFYTNRPDTFGEHSGLGLNIVKNLVDLHSATINATNNATQEGANIEIIFPKV